MAKKNNTVGKIILVMFLRTFIIVIMMVLVGLASYKITLKYYEVNDSGSAESDGVLDIVGDVTADAVSRNLIYSVDAENSKIKAMVIEILNTETGNLDYITIPANTQITIGNEMYGRLCNAGADAPQILQFSKLNKYFENDTAYEYGIILLEDYLDIDIGYYTKMDSEVFDKYFAPAEDNMWYKVSDAVLMETSSITDKDGMSKYIKSAYESLTSNLKVKNKTKYAECYSLVDSELIYYHVFAGNVENGIYKLDEKNCKKQYKTIIDEPAHTVKQEVSANIPSQGKNIKVLNGSGTEGIATATKQLLEGNGLTVVKIADNPEIIENTKICVTEEGMGKDLLYYFNNATIEVATLEEGVDIMVIVGAADSGIINQ